MTTIATLQPKKMNTKFTIQCKKTIKISLLPHCDVISRHLSTSVGLSRMLRFVCFHQEKKIPEMLIQRLFMFYHIFQSVNISLAGIKVFYKGNNKLYGSYVLILYATSLQTS